MKNLSPISVAKPTSNQSNMQNNHAASKRLLSRFLHFLFQSKNLHKVIGDNITIFFAKKVASLVVTFILIVLARHYQINLAEITVAYQAVLQSCKTLRESNSKKSKASKEITA